MKSPSRHITVFSISALDLFASALGAFILLVIILFPYYLRAGSHDNRGVADEKEVSRLMAERWKTADVTKKLLTEARKIEFEVERMTKIHEEKLSRNEELMNAIEKVRTALLSLPKSVPKSATSKEREKESTKDFSQPNQIADGVEFSILGISTKAKSFLIVVDLSGSMRKAVSGDPSRRYSDIMISSVAEVLAPLKPENKFAIMGFHEPSGRELRRFPGGTRLLTGSPDNISRGIDFAKSLTSKFGGKTPTHYALLTAMEYRVDAVIVMSDGEPTDGVPGDIIADIRQLNRGRNRKEVHTVAIGDYTKNPVLVLFLQKLASKNGGDFVGLSR